MTDRRRIWVIGLLAAVIGMPDIALAVPKGPAGQTCKSSGTTTVNGTEEGTGKAMKCTADYCKYDECEGGLPPAGKCYEKTSYSNVRDCKPAAMKGPQSGTVVPPTGGVLQQAPVSPGVPPSKFQRAPMAPSAGTVMPRGVEGEQPTSSEKEGK